MHFHADQKSVVFVCTSMGSPAWEASIGEGLGQVKLGVGVVLAS